MTYFRHRDVVFTASLLALAVSQQAWGGDTSNGELHLPRQKLATSLLAVGQSTKTEVLFQPGDVENLEAPPLDGSYSAEAAVRALIRDSDLTIEIRHGSIILRGRTFSGTQASGTSVADIVVTGTHLKSIDSASQVLAIKAADIELAGQPDLGSAMRSLPQNFSGGQNPGVAPGAIGLANQNLDSGSSPNLRGLGGDATLTLLNGHRLSYGSFVQAVDISTIPLVALDRMEIVPDGASAIYGSDAVGGVVNIILKRDYNGLSTSATVGAATDGGDVQQQYSLVGGKRWNTGGIILAFNHSHNSTIYASQRSYLTYMPLMNTVYPMVDQNNLVVSGHQDIGSRLELSIDGTYSQRTSYMIQQTTSGYSYENHPDVENFSVTPSVKMDLGSEWSAHLSGTYGRSIANYTQNTIYNGSLASIAEGCYCNKVALAELYTTGPAAHLNGLPINVVLGGGYRYNYFGIITTRPQSGSVDSYYAFSEVAVPLVDPSRDIPLVYKLSLDAALRYERYPGMASVAIPKFGLVYGISPDFDLKGTWGRSFKAPTLSQSFAEHDTYLYPASTFGGLRFPTGSAVLIDYGGNTNLKPETASVWSATFSAHPQAIKNLKASVTYFDVTYNNRIVQPVSGSALFKALSDPTYQDFVSYSPTSDTINALVAGSTKLYNYVGTSGLSNVVAVVYDRYINVARQHVNGVDLTLDYQMPTGSASSVSLSANGAWLWSQQQISANAPDIALAGTIFNPPRFKGRFNVSWGNRNLTVAAYANHVGGLIDNRATPVSIAPQTTFDGSLLYHFDQDHGPLHGINATLSAQNIFNAKPPYAAPSGGYTYYVNYDSTNFSPVGRFVSFTISKDW